MKYNLEAPNMFRRKLDEHALREAIADIDDRIEKIEKKVFKSSRSPANLSQQMLIFHHLGILDKITKLETSTNKKAKLLSVLLDADLDNTESFVSNINRAKNLTNYKFLSDLFKTSGLNDLNEVAEKEYDKILKALEKKKDKK
ncbi:MAG TPA: hypothetical protein VNZ49_07655 [Bacteroidia bacterium]|jgi:hypothetical protein|nr:hypothetical protein [Bacteroidia bacterium]